MKFGKNLIQVVDLSNPEWGQYWINYKYLKRKINEIIEHRSTDQPVVNCSDPKEISKDAVEVEFFILIRKELKKASEFFKRCQEEFTIRWERIWESYLMLQEKGVVHDKNTWTRLLMACVRFYKDVLLLENFAIMNYCGFSKILKKHDKVTGYVTRDAFMRNVMNHQNITHYPIVLDLIRNSEQLFHNIQNVESVIPLQDDERLFIDAIRDMNYQASRMQAEESQDSLLNSSQQVETNSSITTTKEDPSLSIPSTTMPDAKLSSHSILPSLPPSSLSSGGCVFQKSVDNIVVTDIIGNNNTKSSSDNNTQQLSDRLDHATMLAVEAALRLNCHNAPPDVSLALSWIPRIASSKDKDSSDKQVLPNESLPLRRAPNHDSESDSKSKRLRSI